MVVAVCSNSLYADRYCGAEGSSGDPFQMAERILWCLKGRSQKWQPMALVAHAEWCREGPDVQCDFLYIARHNTRHPFPVCLASSPVVLYSLLFRCDLSNHCLHYLEMTLSCLPFAETGHSGGPAAHLIITHAGPTKDMARSVCCLSQPSDSYPDFP